MSISLILTLGHDPRHLDRLNLFLRAAGHMVESACSVLVHGPMELLHTCGAILGRAITVLKRRIPVHPLERIPALTASDRDGRPNPVDSVPQDVRMVGSGLPPD